MTKLAILTALATIVGTLIAGIGLFYDLERDQAAPPISAPPPATGASTDVSSGPTWDSGHADADARIRPALQTEVSKSAPRASSPPTVPRDPEATVGETEVQRDDLESPEPAAERARPAEPIPATLPPPEPAAARHWQVTLHDGEQEVFAEGRVSLEIELGRIGSMNVGTLHVRTPQGTRNEPLLDGGGRFEVVDGGDLYVVSVSKPDFERRTTTLRIDVSTP